MKKSKIIIPALGMLVLSTAATVSGTVAWFTMNKTATTEGMVVSAKTSGSLIVKEAPAKTPSFPSALERGTKVIFNSTAHAMYPSTLDWAFTPSSGTNDTGLKVVKNGADINYETGTKKHSDITLEYNPVAVSTDATSLESTSAYYFDYGVFLAGDGLALPSQDIKVTISAKIWDPTANDNAGGYVAYAGDDINAAISVAFYGEAVSSSAQRASVNFTNYMGTLNLAGKKNGETAGSSSAFTTINYNGNASLTGTGVNIPQSGTSAAYAITMRVFYDGALIQTPKSGNDYATYTAGTGTVPANPTILYYLDQQGTIVNLAQNTDATSYFVTDVSNDTILYARSVDVADIQNVKLDIQFEASEHPTGA